MSKLMRVKGMPKTYYHYPRIVAIAGIYVDDKANLIPLVWHTGLSFDPPLYGISISPKRYSFEMLLKAGSFSVNFVPFEFKDKVEKWGSVSGRAVDKFKLTGVSYTLTEELETPIVNIAYLVHECELVEHYKLGDHTLFVGLVKNTYYDPELFDEWTMLKVEKVKPLLYLGKHVYITVDPETRTFEGS